MIDYLKKLEKNIKPKEDKKDWPELYWNSNENIEIISNETILNSVLLGETLPNYLDNLSFNNLKLKLGPDFKLQYSELIQANLDTKLDLNIKGKVGKDLNARGLIYLQKGRANLYTTPFKLDKNKDNYIEKTSRNFLLLPLKNKFIYTEKIVKKSVSAKKTSKSRKREVDLYSEEYLKKKHGLVIKDAISADSSNSNQKSSTGIVFYGNVIILIIFFITIFGILDLNKYLVIIMFPFLETYINYLYDSLEIIKISIYSLIS